MHEFENLKKNVKLLLSKYSSSRDSVEGNTDYFFIQNLTKVTLDLYTVSVSHLMESYMPVVVKMEH